jgi:hypothetical protein
METNKNADQRSEQHANNEAIIVATYRQILSSKKHISQGKKIVGRTKEVIKESIKRRNTH